MHGLTAPAIIRYAITGACVALLYAGLYFLMTRLAHWDRVPASAVALVCAVCLQYFMHAVFTFRRTWKDQQQAARFVITVGTGLFVSHGVTAWAAPALGIPEAASLVLIMLVLPLVNLVIFGLWVFARR
ncbi:polysaccharide biosynthesis protein [Hyphomonas polymorpha PS728]|uniref:Polysaccharide biosynthesis protein n=1 Tax=Hyphomonas polymorpha PS728 TaxID=1280954 RepID=A0A062VLV0_9PROT|nr:GtrA family protein [Hyphomonas polymorpha]KDA00642.1 polysaccharide biosynthesis protein [Hyphomonas polymorpha PS728]